MQILSRTQISKIRFLLPGLNYSNVHAALQGLLPEEYASIFAKINVSGAQAAWSVDDDLQYSTLDTASDMEKEEVADIIAERKNEIEILLKNNVQFGKCCGELFAVPSAANIHFSHGSNGGLTVVLSQWGAKNKSSETNTDVIQSLLVMPRSYFFSSYLEVKYKKDVPAPNEKIDISFFGEPKSFLTDGDGVIAMGRLRSGLTFVASKGDIRQTYNVSDSDNRFELVIPRYTSATVTVLNQKDEPVPGYKLIIENVTYTADADGEMHTNQFEYIQDENLNILDSSGFRNNDVFKLEWEESRNKFVYKIVEHQKSSLTINVMYDNADPAAEYPVTLRNKVDNSIIELVSDDDGVVFLDDLITDDEILVTDGKMQSNNLSVKLNKGCNNCVLTVEREREKMVFVRLHNLDGSTMEGIKIKVKLKSGEMELETDSEGCIYIPASEFTNGEKVINRCHVLDKQLKYKQKK